MLLFFILACWLYVPPQLPPGPCYQPIPGGGCCYPTGCIGNPERVPGPIVF